MNSLDRLRGFGRPAMLSGVTDDLVAEIKNSDAWNQMIVSATDKAYGEIRVLFEADKERLASDVISAAAPGMKQLATETLSVLEPQAKQALYDIFDDAATQARIGQTTTEVRNTLIKVGVAGILLTVTATCVGTFLIVRYAGPR